MGDAEQAPGTVVAHIVMVAEAEVIKAADIAAEATEDDEDET